MYFANKLDKLPSQPVPTEKGAHCFELYVYVTLVKVAAHI